MLICSSQKSARFLYTPPLPLSLISCSFIISIVAELTERHAEQLCKLCPVTYIAPLNNHHWGGFEQQAQIILFTYFGNVIGINPFGIVNGILSRIRRSQLLFYNAIFFW